MLLPERQQRREAQSARAPNIGVAGSKSRSLCEAVFWAAGAEASWSVIQAVHCQSHRCKVLSDNDISLVELGMIRVTSCGEFFLPLPTFGCLSWCPGHTFDAPSSSIKRPTRLRGGDSAKASASECCRCPCYRTAGNRPTAGAPFLNRVSRPQLTCLSQHFRRCRRGQQPKSLTVQFNSSVRSSDTSFASPPSARFRRWSVPSCPCCSIREAQLT